MARGDWQYVNGSTNNNSVFFAGIRWRYRDDLYGTTGYPASRTASNIDIIEYQPFSGRKQSYNTFSYTSWRTSYYRYSYNTTSGSEPPEAANNLNVSTTFRFDKATNNTKYYPVKGALSASNVFNISSDDTSRIIQVPHCSDGTSKVRLFFHYTGDSNTAFSYGETNAVITLDTIPRASTIAVDTSKIGTQTTITITKYSDSFSTVLSYRVKNGSSSNWITIATTSAKNYNWTPPTSLYTEMTSTQKSIILEFKADTIDSGSSPVGDPTYTEQTFTASGNPEITTRTATDINSTTAQLSTGTNTSTTKVVKYGSNVQIEITAKALNGATIISASVNGVAISLDGSSSSVQRSGTYTFNKATTNVFSITVKDSRDNITTLNQSNSMDIINYIPLSIITDTNTFKRNLPTDGKININIRGNVYTGTFRTNVGNNLTVYYRWKESGASSWQQDWTSSGLSVTTSGNSFSATKQLTGMDYTKVYIFEAKAVDSVNTSGITANNITVPKGEPIYWWDNDEFHVNGTLYTSNAGRVDYAPFGFTYDGAGNMRHKRSDGGDNFGIDKYDGTRMLSFWPESGTTVINGSATTNGLTVNGDNGTNNIVKSWTIEGKSSFNDDAYTKQSFIGSTNIGGTWYNLINVRHRNGGGDGTSYGMQIRKILTSDGNLEIRSNYGGSWTNWTEIPFKTTTGTGIVTRSSGATLNSSTWRRFGNVVQLTIVITSSGTTNTGSNAFTGTINNSTFIPKIPINSSSYNGSTALNCYIDSNGNITCRVLASNLSSGKELTIGFTYVI